ncbi:MAG: CYTH and CHAD domain-containing protein [Alphaproteobacteria bacterium]|nr:CYTH and CHAD domain-containing protein [Alphaproteobacteria bacterium]
MAAEIELKFALPESTAAAFVDQPLIARLAQGPYRRRRMVNTYYDTPALDLFKAGLSLRVRAVGGRNLLSVKAGENPALGARARAEWEGPLAGAWPDLAAIDDRRLQKRVQKAVGDAGLQPVFRTEIQRRTRRLGFKDSIVELAVDRGLIRAGERKRAVSEIELELVEGRPVRLFELAQRLRKRMELVPETESKSDRGYRLAADRPPAARRAPPVELDPAMTAGQAFAVIARGALWQMRVNAPIAQDGRDIEGVHQLRVGLRRLRALLALFRSRLPAARLERLRPALRRLQNLLGPARDWDVLIARVLRPIAGKRAADRGLRAFRAAAEERRERAYARLRRSLERPGFQRLMLATEAWVERMALRRELAAEEARERARRILRKRDRKLRRLGENLAKLSDGERHQFRIEAKKLRYAAEFFRSLYDEAAARAYIAALAAIQDRLGALNDAAMVKTLRRELEESGFEPSPKAAGLIDGWVMAHIAIDMDGLEADWAKFLAAPRFWRAD